MKKIYMTLLFVAVALMPYFALGQELMQNGGLETWDDVNTPTNWDKAENITQESTEIHEGTYAAAHESASSTKDLQQVIEGVVGGQTYTISYWYKDNDAMARTRIWSYWLEDGSTLSDNEDVLRPTTYSEDNADWQKWSATLTAPVNANGFRFEVRVYNQDNQTGGFVYYDHFSFNGDQTVYPEPSNYPTAFTATASGVTITLDWTDAVGDQLPSAYLIQGEEMPVRNSAFEVPVDGTPVADDLDFSDGSGAVNVLFGVETFEFTGLTPGTAYQFVIYPYTNAGSDIDYKTDGEAPVTDAVTDNITILNEEYFDDGLGTWTPYNVTGDQVWEQSEFGGQTFAKMSGYDGAPFDNEDWLISPQMDWSNYSELYFKFISAMNYTGPNLQLFVSQDYDGSGNPNDFTWTEISDNFAWSDGGWNWVASGDGDLLSYSGPSAYLAFMFTSNTDGSATWELDDLMVYGMKTNSIGHNDAKTVSIYPNPAADFVTIDLEAKASVQLLNLNGQTLVVQSLNEGQNQLNTAQLSTGIYLLQIKYEDGSFLNKKLIIE
ncbi:MAG: T9SS type A sorting domain-containing protein [Bacteroidales bacterium]|nr:T9SS type A sorting domain-containing protein [Bacteroidales bacterium]MCF6342445.1 T9SS type A sorting domain-containing protein [Bacteroidales bacterium]